MRLGCAIVVIRDCDPKGRQPSSLHFLQVVAYQADVRNPEAVKQVASSCVEELGLPHIVVNNAAGNFISPTEKLSANAFKTIIDIVVLGTANVTLEFGKRLINAEQGKASPRVR